MNAYSQYSAELNLQGMIMSCRYQHPQRTVPNSSEIYLEIQGPFTNRFVQTFKS